MATRYRDLLMNTRHLTVRSVPPEVAEEAATLRARHGFRTPDAIQLATAQIAGATGFLTNDVRLSDFPGLDVLVLDRLL